MADHTDHKQSIPSRTQEHIIKGSADEWNALVSSALGELETRPVDHKRTFSGRLAHRSLGDLVCVNLRSNRLDVIRQERFISDPREDFFKVNFNLPEIPTDKTCPVVS